MGFNQTAGLAVAECMLHLKKHKNLSVIEFGNQRFKLNKKTLERISSKTGVSFNFSKDKQEYLRSTNLFYEQLGFKEYLAIDLNTNMNAIVLDLNYNCKSKYGFNKQFDLVTNSGTGEHIFNQYEVFRNMHEMTKVGGIMLNILPMGPWINHGFYNYHPVLFRDLAYANNYKWCFFWVGDMLGHLKAGNPNMDISKEVPRTYPYLFYSGNNPSPREESSIENFVNVEMRKHGHVVIVSAFRKLNNDDFKIPLQGKWIHNIEDEQLTDIKGRYAHQPDTFDEFHS